MKQLLILVLCAITCTAMGQKSGGFLVTPIDSDTLKVYTPLRFHYIKIGEAVYKITEHEPTIEKADPNISKYWSPMVNPGPSIDTGILYHPQVLPFNRFRSY